MNNNGKNQFEIMLPVYNEQEILERNVLRIIDFFDREKLDYRLTIIDTASTDDTYLISRKLYNRFPDKISIFRLNKRGRGRALRLGLLKSNVSIIGYMDIDLSVDLRCFKDLFFAVLSGYDIAVSSRFSKDSYVRRSFFRNLLSRVYNFLVVFFLNLDIKDVQCGFKLFRRESILNLLPFIKNDNWWFDTELLFLANRKGVKIKEISVIWREREDGRSKVKVLPCVLGSLKTLMRLYLKSLLSKLAKPILERQGI
jgi:glycosyltransferase involved in cell wall biosynthesis